ncbi:hypothetical protein J2801_006168, partial [Paraburkholderia phenoliruptrix]|nr:hypothetical protein [Paraburkholderia phenoliruptrix]
MLFCIAASLFASPWAFAIEADTPNPCVPYDTPTLALLDALVLRVESASVVLTRLTWFFAARITSVALTFDPAIVSLPLPDVPSPVATNAAV